MTPDPKKFQALMLMPPPKCKKELQSFLGILNYLIKFSPVSNEARKPLSKPTLVKAEWSWNRMYQDLSDRAKKLITKDSCMKFYNALKPIYTETDASGVSIGAGSLWVTVYELWV